MAGAHVDRVSDLIELSQVVRSFSDRVESSTVALRGQALDRIEALRAVEEQLEREIEDCEHDSRSLDDDFDSRDSDTCRDLQERLESVRVARASLERALDVFESEVANCRSELFDGTRDAARLLGRKVDALHGYVRAARSTSAGPSPSSSARVSTARPPLPDGFTWVRIDEIDADVLAELPTRESFRKIPYDQMRRGLELFASEILPRMASSGGALDVDSLAANDQSRGRPAAEGAAEVYRALFGQTTHEYIRLERSSSRRGYTISNGRHRIRVAIDLGWDAIPARVEGS